ncbi:MAG: hypothetical protein ACLUL3_12605, partial [Romboutsia timonensis]|uniref:hypothetical protein n=1 Tax=Romboutsia timonensis TaxID=1776391 RepID=UPI003991805C
MDILFKNSFTLTEKLILECRVAFISKWDKFFSLLFLFTSLFGFIYSESNLTTKFISIYLMFMCVYLIFILPTLRSKKMYKRYLAINNYEQLHESVNFYNDIFEVISSNGSRVSISYKNLKKIYNRNKMDPIWWTREKACLSIW